MPLSKPVINTQGFGSDSQRGFGGGPAVGLGNGGFVRSGGAGFGRGPTSIESAYKKTPENIGMLFR